MADPQLLDAIADYISRYRKAGGVPALMQQAVLAEFPTASSSDFAIGLTLANRRERAGRG